MSTWFVWSGGAPIYYDYGSNVYYDNNVVYVNDQPVGTAQQYAESAIQLADVTPPAESADVEWLPLGMFAVTTDEKTTEAVMYFQLAVSKEGIIGGTYHNSSSGSTQPVQGSVDRKTQRAAWSVGDKSSIVLETGIYNLTQDETPVLVHFDKDRVQTWFMVRLPPPEETSP